MGLFDKVKAFAGGKGMAKVTIPVIERQPSESLYVAEDTSGSGTPNLVASAKDPDENTSYADDMLKMPCDLKEGQTSSSPGW